MNSCVGCGALLQNSNINGEGYTKTLDRTLCERCFRIKHYNDYKFVLKNNNDFINILKNVGASNDLVVLVIDLFNLNNSLNDIYKYIKNDVLLVLSKRDILPKSVYDENLISYFKKLKLNIIDSVIISSKKNYNFDLLYSKINEYKKSSDVYVVGYTNAGKSTMINKILYNYSDSDIDITTSNLPSTTINSITVKVNDDLTLIDTPGLLNEDDIINYLDKKEIEKVIPNSEINPITYQIKTSQSIIIDDVLRVDCKCPNNLTFYMSNRLKHDRLYKESSRLTNLKKHNLSVDKDSDIVIQGLGFIHVTHNSDIIVYTKDGVSVYCRESLI